MHKFDKHAKTLSQKFGPLPHAEESLGRLDGVEDAGHVHTPMSV